VVEVEVLELTALSHLKARLIREQIRKEIQWSTQKGNLLSGAMNHNLTRMRHNNNTPTMEALFKFSIHHNNNNSNNSTKLTRYRDNDHRYKVLVAYPEQIHYLQVNNQVI